jgi:flagellar hook assembly protein FlgD
MLGQNVMQRAGNQQFVWNGTDNRNVILPDGLYMVRITAIDGVKWRSEPAVIQVRVDTMAPQIVSMVANTNVLKVVGNNRLQIRYTLSEAATIDVKLFDADNQLVGSLQTGAVPKGVSQITWDGKWNNKYVKNGMYYLKVNATDAMSKKMQEVRLDVRVQVEFFDNS